MFSAEVIEEKSSDVNLWPPHVTTQTQTQTYMHACMAMNTCTHAHTCMRAHTHDPILGSSKAQGSHIPLCRCGEYSGTQGSAAPPIPLGTAMGTAVCTGSHSGQDTRGGI